MSTFIPSPAKPAQATIATGTSRGPVAAHHAAVVRCLA